MTMMMISRRQALISAVAGVTAAAASAVCSDSQTALAMNGLVMFPLTQALSNNYILVHAGQSRADKRGVVSTNPVNKISVDLHGLTPIGVRQADLIASAIKPRVDAGNDVWIWPSQNIACLETSDILAYRLALNQSRVVPEFAFLDARGLGAYEGRAWADIQQNLLANDTQDSSIRPPPGEDGTPNESMEDVFVRVRQLISKTETQYTGADIVFIAPDSFTLAALETSLLAQPLTDYANHLFKLGEVREVQPVIVTPPPRQTLPL